MMLLTDVYSYSEDDMVTDPSLSQHLAHWGIDIMKMTKVSSCIYLYNLAYVCYIFLARCILSQISYLIMHTKIMTCSKKASYEM